MPGGRNLWQRYADAAVRSPALGEAGGPEAGAGVRGPRTSLLWNHGLQPDAGRGRPAERRRRERQRRADLRLVPPALLVWGTAVAGNWLNPAELALLCGGMAAAGAMLLVVAGCSHVGHSHVGRRTVGRAGPGREILRYDPRHGPAAPRSFRATLAAALLLSVAAGAHAAVESSRRHDGAIAEAVDARAAVVAEVEVAGAPRRLRTPGASGLADRWAVPVTLKVVTFDGRRIAGDARFVVMGGTAWEHAVPGQQLRTTGRVRAAAPGEPDAGILSASSAPTVLRGPGFWQKAPGGLRRSFTAAAARFGGDASGLLPGMVTGDTSALNAELEDAMKTVGMTHLTAVSGANCSLILGTLLLTARTLRLPRVAAAAASLAGLGLFVLMVGPDPSVLRAALMGGIGLASIASGRAGRGLSLLCVAVICLLLVQPVLATSFGFVLSVLATLGIVIAGRRIMDWIPAPVPRWAAGGVAVPLSAQLFCGPVIVLLQPQFGAYALAANVAAAALVAPVTLLGTAAAVLLPVVPAAAELLMAPAAALAGAVAGIARFFAALPGATLPWPEGGFGAATMGIFSATVLGMVWLALHPAAVVRSSLAAHAWTVAVLAGWPPAMRAPGSVRRSGQTARQAARQSEGYGLEHRSGRGTLRVCKPTSGRNHEWLLPRPHGPGPRRRRAPPGAM
ncbi:hypothetical protein GCM10009825_32110 [Arthrobacter humicola]|uniref:ComEC/Rec2-related protein domain-containing protein n=1 Tax=Arthrobacter humicola TaxID=409291 RepID=A0ABN2ZI05_9MICC